jgi:hypothetical protein
MEAKRYLESLLTPSMSLATQQLPSAPVQMSLQRAETQSAPADPVGSWQRVEIEPGLELHIRSDYMPPASSAKTKSLAERIRGAINRLRRDKH